MWSQLALCLLVGLAYAKSGQEENPAWEQNSQYIYEFRARSLASLDQVSNDYSGIFLRANLEVNPRSDGNLDARIIEPQYAQIHGELSEGWDQDLPESELNFQQLPLSAQPFQIELNEGAVRNVIVSEQILNWEANVIKAIVSQFQLDTKAKNLIPSSINALPEGDSQTGVYKTMEETITGVAETLYEIHPLQQHLLKSQPWLVSQNQLSQNDEVIEIVKTKNYTNSEQAPSYHFGLNGIDSYEPSNKVGDFLSRSAVTWAVVTGNLGRYTIQNSVTVEEIFLSPTLSDKQKGSVHTRLNITLLEVKQQNQQNDNNVPNPVEVGLVYGYSSPYGDKNSPRPVTPFDHSSVQGSYEAQSEESQENGRKKRSIGSSYANSLPRSFNYHGRSGSSEEQDWHQNQPKLSEPFEAPLLPFLVGYNGQSIKSKHNVPELVLKLAQTIGQEYQQPPQIPQENTVGKFVTLTSVVRTMNKNEIQQVASQLYTKQSQENQNGAWIAFRDSVAQAGTGPALEAIIEWIQSDKICNEEASEIVATVANAAREPTVEYMNAYFQMIRNDNIMQQQSLNESLLLSYTRLVYQVYSNKQDSHNKYPVHSFGTFRSQIGQDFVTKEVIPFLTQQLNEAISDGDTEQIHVYIRALGNLGQQEILEAFEPYLEGQKQASHFQRVLMVLALDQLVNSNPRVARSVLYKIYQNPSEYDQVRVAAVYQLMRTVPSPSMLQRMAAYTQVDASSYVNAAVQSAINSASELKGYVHTRLRQAAASAKPLLTSQEYGVQYSQQYFRSYVYNHMPLSEASLLFSGEDDALPNGLIYTLRGRFGGVKHQYATMQAMVSSVEDLVSVFRQQTKEYQQQQNQKQQANPQQHPWTSEYVAKVLNMQNEQREQLEGNLYLRMDNLQKILSFDNQTIDNFTELVSELEQELKQGKSFQYNKMSINKEIAVAVPTSLGLPFLYTYDVPTLVRFEAKVQASASPEISQGNVLQQPQTVNAEFQINALVSARIQSQLGIFTPFNHQRYSAGYDKNIQAVIPLIGNMKLNVQEKQLQFELQNPATQEDVQLLHYSNLPYTSQNDIYSPKPELNIIRSQYPYQFNQIVGEKSTGIALKVQMSTDKWFDQAFVFEKLQSEGVVGAMLGPWAEANIQYINADVWISASASSTDKVAVELGYLYQNPNNQQGSPSQQLPNPESLPSEVPQFSEESQQRQQEFMSKVTKDIGNVEGLVVDASVKFQGQKQIQYQFTAAGAKSNADPMGQFMVLLKKYGNQQEPMQFYTYAASYFPNTNGLNLDYAMQINPEPKINILALLQRNQRCSRVNAQVQLSKSQKRREYLQHQPEYQQCKQEMQEGNYQLPVCAWMTARANLLDQFSISTKYQDIDPILVNSTYKAYSIFRYYFYSRIQENIVDSQQSNSNSFDIEGQFSPSLQYLNFSINSDYGNVEAKNIHINKWAKDLLVPQPVFHAKARLIGQALKYDTYRPICVVDQNSANTFDNKTYPISLNNAWTVLLQYVPRRPSSNSNQPDQTVLQQLQENVESYVVYVRASEQISSQKEIKIVFQSPNTEQQIVEILIQPQGNSQPQVIVNNKPLQYSEQQAYDLYDGFVQVYALPNYEVKVELRGVFYIIFNGQTVKLTAVSSKLRDASRGLCGTFTGEPETDFLTPENCIIEHAQEFVESYTLSGNKMNARSNSGRIRRENNQQDCVQKEVNPANYISDQDAGRQQVKRSGSERNSCTRLQTQFVEQGDEICFTLRPLPICKQECQVRGQVSKNVAVHCAQQSDATQLWKNEILKGASPDFSFKHKSRTIKLDVPQRCLA